jgi:hypothetical protein
LIHTTDTKKKLTYLIRQTEGWIEEDFSQGSPDLWYIVQVYKKATSLREFSILLDMRLKLMDINEFNNVEVNCGFDSLKEEQSLLEEIRSISVLEFIKHCLISDNSETVSTGENFLKHILSKGSEEIKNDTVLHILVCARSDIHHFTKIDIWNNIEGTLLWLCAQQISDQHELYHRVVSELVRNRNISLSVSLVSRLTNSPTQLTSGLLGWKFLLDSYPTYSQILTRKQIHQLMLVTG